MLIEGVPPAMIENAAKMAGMPVGPLSLSTRSRSISPEDHEGHRSPISARPSIRADEADQQMVDEAGPPRPQERQGLLRLSGEAGQEVAVAGPQGPLSAKPVDPDSSMSRSSSSASSSPSRWKPRAPSRKASSPIRARPMSARSSASASRPIPAAC
jgi:hypothetical protein